MKKRLLSTLIALCMVLTLLPGTAWAAGETSGTCGENINWYLQGDGTLLLDGSGKTYDYGGYWFLDPAPWDKLSDQITSIKVQGNITYLGTAIFESCTNAVGITLPESIEEIAGDALPQYGACQYVITGPSGNGNYVGDGVALYVKDAGQYSGSGAFDGKHALLYYPPAARSEKYTLDPKTELIVGTFAGNPYLKEVTLNEKLTTIGYSAFSRCSNLQTINIPYGVEIIRPWAFQGCTSLTNISLPESLISLSPSAFDFCPIERIVVPASVTELDTDTDGADGNIDAPDVYREWYFLGNAPKLNGYEWIENYGLVDGEYALLSTRIYYPENASGWTEFIKNYETIPGVKTEFQAYSSTESGGTAAIKGLYPLNGATDVGYDASNPPIFQITFDREIASGSEEYWADVDLSSDGAFKIYRASDDALIYPNRNTNHWYSEDSFSLAYDNKNILLIKPVNAYNLFKSGTKYYVTMGEGFVNFVDGSTNQAINKGDWGFTTSWEYFSTTANVTIKTGDKKTPTASEPTSWDDRWFLNDSTTYIHKLATTSMALSGAAYVEKNGQPDAASIRDALQSFGFTSIEDKNYPTNGDDSVAYTLAYKILDDIGDHPTYLVSIVIKGTSNNGEWYGNFNIGINSTHAGFSKAKDELMAELNQYLRRLPYDKNTVKFLVTGHSRGAAVANLVLADLTRLNYAKKTNIFGYTFATPTVSTLGTEEGYENIFNIISGEDFITQVPLGSWNYKHYGTDLLLPSKSYYLSYCLDQYHDAGYPVVSSKMASKYSDLVDKEFEFYKDGTQAVDNLTATAFRLAPSLGAYYNQDHIYAGPLVATGWPSYKTTSEYFSVLADFLVPSWWGAQAGELLELTSSLRGEYAPITNFFVLNHALSPRVFSAHSMACYYSWLSSCTAEELFGDMNKRTDAIFKRIQWACPVDVYVYDEDGKLVASVVNEEIQENILAVGVEDTVKTIDLPSDQVYSVEVIATDAGNVDYTIEEWSIAATGNDVLRTVKFNDIEIESGDELTGKVNDILYTDSNNYALKKNDQTTIYPDSDTLKNGNQNSGSNSNNSGGNSSGSSGSSGGSSSSSSSVTGVNVGSTQNGSVSVSPRNPAYGSTVTITPKPNSGYEVDTVTVTDKNGNNVAVTQVGNGTYTFVMPSARPVTVKVTFAKSVTTSGNLFNDVASGAYYYDAVLWALENGVTEGYSDNTFRPDATCTRAQIMTFLWRANGSPEPDSAANSFTDAKADAYYAKAVQWAMERGITTGTTATTFNPDGSCTRAQAMTFLWRSNGSPAVSGGNFSDVPSGKYYADAITWAAANGVSTGYADGTFAPDNSCTRAQIVTFLYRDRAS